MIWARPTVPLPPGLGDMVDCSTVPPFINISDMEGSTADT